MAEVKAEVRMHGLTISQAIEELRVLKLNGFGDSMIEWRNDTSVLATTLVVKKELNG